MKLSLCMIIKATDEEAKLLDRCLSYSASFFDEICITITGKNKECQRVAKSFGAKISYFKWINDFASARNFNFSQATGDYVFWMDADDILKGGENLKDVAKMMDDKKIDIGVMNYLYHFNKNGTCDTKHIKSRIIKNDGCVEWAGIIHEDFKENRTLDTCFIDNIEILHLTTDERVGVSADRNYEIAQEALKKDPEDPRSYWLMGNALIMQNKPKESAENFKIYIEKSDSNEEKYLANLMLFSLEKDRKYALEALFLRPSYPDAYLRLGDWLYEQKKYNEAITFIELGLQMPIPELEIIAYNPREYDMFPLITLSKIYFEMGKYEKAVRVVDELAKMFPKETVIKDLKKLFEKESLEIEKVDEVLRKTENIKDMDELEKYLDSLPEDIASHPKVCSFKNSLFYKKESSGKDLVYYCSYTSKYWNPDIAMTDGVGGSEEAVINLTKELAKKGWNITVYNNCKKEGEWDGVKYRYYWKYNVRDKQDVTILWRHPKPCDHEINSDKIYIDMHDVIADAEFNKKRLAKIDKVFLKTNAHRKMFPSIPDEKVAIIPNGIDPELFEKKVKKNPYLILNTSSADRHLDATLDIFEELIKVSDKPWKLAWYYGWGVYDDVHKENKERMEWKQTQIKRFNKLVKEGRAEGGMMIGHQEIADKYLEAGIFLYPTHFAEIHCISAVKAQLAGCKCITSDAFALDETIKYGIKIHTDCEKWHNGSSTFGDDDNIQEYVYQILNAKEADKNMIKWAKETYNWQSLSEKWNKYLSTRQ